MNHNQLDRAESQRQTDEMIENKLGSSNFFDKIFAWLARNCNWSCN